MIKTLGIIGTAGRSNSRPLTGEDWAFIRETAEQYAIDNGYDRVVSGGAAWADHAAFMVSLNRGLPLILCLPCAWDYTNHQYVDSGDTRWWANVGGVANSYHEKFKKVTGVPSLEQIYIFMDYNQNKDSFFTYYKDSFFTYSDGFHERNKAIVHYADEIIAFTTSTGDTPNDGGTKHTWDFAQVRNVPCKHFTL